MLRSAAGATDVTSPDSLGHRVSHRRGFFAGSRVRPWVVAAASMAASLLLFGSGVFLGHGMGARSTERVMLAVREHDNVQLAQRIQEAGSAYVSALVALGKLRATAGPGIGGVKVTLSSQEAWAIQQGREAALGALYGAASELNHMTPGDSDISQVLQILEERRFQETGAGGAKRTVWR